MRRCCGREALFRRAAQMLLEPLHQCGIGALEIGGSGALEPVSGAFDSNERRGHARFRQRSVHRLSLVYRDGRVGVAVHDERGSRVRLDEVNG